MTSSNDDAQERAVETNQAPTGINVLREDDSACGYESGVRYLRGHRRACEVLAAMNCDHFHKLEINPATPANPV